MQEKPSEYELTYFGIQAEWGVTKHLGGRPATQRLAERCGLRTNHPTPMEVLVVGCGTGVSAVYLAQTYGCRVTGVDLSPRMVAWAQDRAVRKQVLDRTEFRTADAQALPFEDGRFDAVLSESVTAFIPDKPKALGEYARVTRPNGCVGLNEGTWLETPPADLESFVRRSMGGVDFMPAERWQVLLTGARLVNIESEVEHLDSRSQRRAEMAGMDIQDWIHYLRAYGQVLRLLLTDASFRKYTRSLVPSRQVMRDLFRFLGYGLYIGWKAPEEG